MRSPFWKFLFLPILASAAPLTIDLTTPVPPAAPAPYGPGATRDPQGHEITADSRSFFLDGTPWVPISGEFHYSRYPCAEWRDELLKMKAGGITVVSTYVFWIHQEEVQGKFDWSGQRSLRDFLLLCQDLGLKAFVRMGPWCHGEVRNGGFPDWVQNSGTRLRTTDPAYLSLVEPLFKEEARQMHGLLWKDGGPVIGVQLENECDNAPYLLALKKMAQADGIDVPYYAVTGWQGGLPEKGVLPLFGGYTDGFWGGSLESYRKEFEFTNLRSLDNLGAELTDKSPSTTQLINQFPFACVEIGPGMMSCYVKRIKVDPQAAAALALTKLGCGNNLPGYYMYQGGINPDGLLTTLQEDHPHPMPVKDYDFQTALGACGQVRDQFHLLLEQHLLLQQFGPLLARMPAYFPDKRPASLKDFDTLRWDVRSDGTSGFLFYNNKQPSVPLPDHPGIQFQLKTAAGPLVIPREPVTIPSGAFGIWPFNLNLDGVTLQFATAQPLCRIHSDAGVPCYFFAAQQGIVPEMVFPSGAYRFSDIAGAQETDGEIRALSKSAAFVVTKPDNSAISIAILTAGQARHLYRVNFAGRDRLILSNSTVLSDGASLRLQADNTDDLTLSIFPPLPALRMGDTRVPGVAASLFKRYTLPGLHQPPAFDIGVTQQRPAGPAATTLTGTNEATWSDAAVYKLDIPPDAANHHVTASVHYIGDAARLYLGDKLIDDNFSNGDPFAIALWRIPAAQWPNLRLKILPYSDALARLLPASAVKQAAAAKAASTLDRVTVTATQQLELSVTPP